MTLKLIGMAEMAATLGITQKTLLKHVRAGLIPTYRIGDRYVFDGALVLEAIKVKIVPAAEVNLPLFVKKLRGN